MITSFIPLKKQLKDGAIDTLITFLDQHDLKQYNDYLLFEYPRIEKQFKQNLTFLASKLTLPASLVTDKKYHVLAQTIDGDYLLANNQEVLVVPSSFNEKDCETYPLTGIDFLITFEEGMIHSAILAD